MAGGAPTALLGGLRGFTGRMEELRLRKIEDEDRARRRMAEDEELAYVRTARAHQQRMMPLQEEAAQLANTAARQTQDIRAYEHGQDVLADPFRLSVLKSQASGAERTDRMAAKEEPYLEQRLRNAAIRDTAATSQAQTEAAAAKTRQEAAEIGLAETRKDLPLADLERGLKTVEARQAAARVRSEGLEDLGRALGADSTPSGMKSAIDAYNASGQSKIVDYRVNADGTVRLQEDDGDVIEGKPQEIAARMRWASRIAGGSGYFTGVLKPGEVYYSDGELVYSNPKDGTEKGKNLLANSKEARQLFVTSMGGKLDAMGRVTGVDRSWLFEKRMEVFDAFQRQFPNAGFQPGELTSIISDATEDLPSDEDADKEARQEYDDLEGDEADMAERIGRDAWVAMRAQEIQNGAFDEAVTEIQRAAASRVEGTRGGDEGPQRAPPAAISLLRSDPGAYRDQFIAKYGEDQLPADLRQ